MRGVAVILLALALEVPYRASYRLQTPTRPSAAVRITPMLTKRVLAMSSLKNLPLIAVSRQRRKISPSKSIFRWLVKEWRRTRSATYFIASITMQILALIAPSRFRADTSLSERESWLMWTAKINLLLCLGMKSNILR
jgi:hypothetical protein